MTRLCVYTERRDFLHFGQFQLFNAQPIDTVLILIWWLSISPPLIRFRPLIVGLTTLTLPINLRPAVGHVSLAEHALYMDEVLIYWQAIHISQTH